MLRVITLAACCLSFVGCSSDSSTPDNSGDIEANTSDTDLSDNTVEVETNEPNTTLIGVFLDSAVEGISYGTETLSGVTNESGEFQYQEGESVTFSIGTLELPQILAQDEVSPVDMSPTESIDDNTTVNIARLLQSMDVDSNPVNGITISEVASASAVPLDFSQTPQSFSNDTDVINLVANSGSSSNVLISPDIATAHLSNTLGIADFIRIDTLDNFNSEVVDRTLLLGNGDRIVVTSNSTVELLTSDGTTVLGTWEWQDSFYCRVVSTNNDAPMSDCQVVELDGDQVRFTRNEGAGEVVVFTIQ